MTEEKKSILEKLADEWNKWKDNTGREAQKRRWQLRRNKRRVLGLNIRKRRATKKGESKGAFGTSPGHGDPSPALKPAEMVARYRKVAE